MEYHPQTGNLFVTSDNKGNVCLRDARMAFDSTSSTNPGGRVIQVCIRKTIKFGFYTR